MNSSLQVSVHVFEDQVQISVIVRSMDIEQLNNVGMIAEGLEEDDFPKRSLSVSLVAKSVKYFLDGH